MLAYSYYLHLLGQEDKPLCYVLNIPRGLKWVIQEIQETYNAGEGISQ